MQLGLDPTERMHECGAGISDQLTFEPNHAIRFLPGFSE